MDTDLRGAVSGGVRMEAPSRSGYLTRHNAPTPLGQLHKQIQNTNEHKSSAQKVCVWWAKSLTGDITDYAFRSILSKLTNKRGMQTGLQILL